MYGKIWREDKERKILLHYSLKNNGDKRKEKQMNFCSFVRIQMKQDHCLCHDIDSIITEQAGLLWSMGAYEGTF